jgi:Na+/H+-dicarboxylate symporter
MTFPALIGGESEAAQVAESVKLTPYFSLTIPPIMDVMTALVTAFLMGLGIAYVKGDVLRRAATEFKDIISNFIEKVIIPLLPLYIYGIFLDMTVTGEVGHILNVFIKIIGIIFALHIVWLVGLYCVAGAIGGRNPLKMLSTMMPAYFTALGTQSSAATIPVTLAQTKKNGVREDIADFVIPLCATIHLSGSTLKITACAIAIMSITGMDYTAASIIGFILMLGITMVAAPGVPGGAIMAAIGILQSMLGFDETAIALMIALYIAMDSFGTATNVTGDGAIAVIIEKISKKIKL